MSGSSIAALPIDGTPTAVEETSIPTSMNEQTGSAVPAVDINKYLTHSVHDLLSLKGRTIVITGGARGLGLAFAFAVAEVGGNLAILDVLDSPHEHYKQLQEKFDVKTKLYKYVKKAGQEIRSENLETPALTHSLHTGPT